MFNVKISGREYPERPPSKLANVERVRRLLLIADSLKFASEHCSEQERRLYKSILEVRAHAENLVDQVRGERLRDPSFTDLLKHAHEP